MFRTTNCLLGLAVSSLFAGSAFAQTFSISIGVRETGVSGTIGANGGASGVIEWINKDGLSLAADGLWHQFTFTFGTDPVTGFTGDGVLDGTFGTFENIRILNNGGAGSNPITWYVDDIVNRVGGTDFLISDFESFAPGVEAVFRLPSLSGSTQNYLQAGDTTGVSNEQAHTGVQSDKSTWAFNSDPAAWLRMSTYNTPNVPNPIIDFSPGNTLSFWAMATVTLPTLKWTHNGDGNWSDTGNWANGTVPNGATASANFLNDISVPSNVNLDIPVTVNTVRFNSAVAYTLSGTNTLTLSGSVGSTANINNEVGNHTISAPVSLVKSLQIAVVNAADTLTISGNVSVSAPLLGLSVTKTGAGRVNVRNLRDVSLAVTGGKVGMIADNSATGVSQLNGLTISGGTDAWTSTLDMASNSALVDYAAGTTLPTIQNQLKSGYNGGGWNGTGIQSSSAATATNPQTAIAYAEASDFATLPPIFTGLPNDGTAVVLFYTVAGDVTFDRSVTGSDFNVLATNFGGSGKTWVQGDFTYDGNVNSGDFNVLASNFGKTLVTSPGASVPEPTTLGLLSLATFLTTRRRR